MKSFYCNGKHALCDLDTCPDDCEYFDDSGGELIYEPDVVTNADRIRSMTDEQLRDFLEKFRVETYTEPFGEKFCKSCPTTEVYCSPLHDTLKLTECDFADGVCPHGDSLAWWLSQTAEEVET